MASLSDRHTHTGQSGGAIDQALVVAWIVSDIAVDVFGMLFWSALALTAVRAIG